MGIIGKFEVNPACVEVIKTDDPVWRQAQALAEVKDYNTNAEISRLDRYYFKKFEAKDISAYEIPTRQRANRKYAVSFGIAAAASMFASIDIAASKGLVTMAESLYPYIAVVSAGLSIESMTQLRSLGQYLLTLKDSDPIQAAHDKYFRH